MTKKESHKDKCKDLNKMFDRQMETIKSRLDSINIPSKAILESFYGKRNDAIQKMLEIWLEFYSTETIEILAQKGKHLGIPVISRVYLGINELMNMVRNNKNRIHLP